MREERALAHVQLRDVQLLGRVRLQGKSAVAVFVLNLFIHVLAQLYIFEIHINVRNIVFRNLDPVSKYFVVNKKLTPHDFCCYSECKGSVAHDQNPALENKNFL